MARLCGKRSCPRAARQRVAAIKDAALLAETKALRAKLEPAASGGFEGGSGTLASLETAAEGSDAAPTEAVRQTAAATIAQLNGDWSAWQQVKTADLAQLNARLKARGLKPIVVPTGAALRVKPPSGGIDLP